MGVDGGGRPAPVSGQLPLCGEPDAVHEPLRGVSVAGVVDAQPRRFRPESEGARPRLGVFEPHAHAVPADPPVRGSRPGAGRDGARPGAW